MPPTNHDSSPKHPLEVARDAETTEERDTAKEEYIQSSRELMEEGRGVEDGHTDAKAANVAKMPD